jgi:hypothetical protein
MRHLEGCSIFRGGINPKCDCGMLLAQTRQTDRTHKFEEALMKIGRYTSAHDDVIDASWVAKVIDAAMTLEGN